MDPDPQVDPAAEAAVPVPERFWAEVLSREPERIRAALGSLSKAEADSVKDHLRRMATEDGWHPAQRRSARAALDHFETPSETETG
jgi:hypothetical protein